MKFSELIKSKRTWTIIGFGIYEIISQLFNLK